MHKFTLLALAAGAAIGSGITVVGSQVQAQGAPPPGMERPGNDHMGMDHMAMDHMGGDMRHSGEEGPGWRMRMMMHRMRQFALIYPAADRALSGADVQKIAEAFLLFNGNHTWKVTDVAEEPNRVTFSFATPDGGVIAKFAMDRHTGRPERLG